MSAKIGRRREDPGTQPNAELNLAEIFCAKGDLERAQDQYDSVYRYRQNPTSSHWMRFRYSIRMFAGLGSLALARGDLAAARLHSAECLALATRTNARKNLVRGWRLASDIARAERDRETAGRSAATVARPRGIARQPGSTMENGTGARPSAGGRRSYTRSAACLPTRPRRDDEVRTTLRAERLQVAFDRNPDLRLVEDRLAVL